MGGGQFADRYRTCLAEFQFAPPVEPIQGAKMPSLPCCCGSRPIRRSADRSTVSGGSGPDPRRKTRDRVGRRRGWVTVAPMPDAIAISASADREAAVGKIVHRGGDARRGSGCGRGRRRVLSCAEVDRRRRAVRAAEDVAQVDRLAEMRAPPVGARRPAGSSRPRRAKPMRAIFDQSAIRPTPPMVGVGRMPGRWFRCRARRCPRRSGSRAPGRPRRCLAPPRPAGP